MGLSSTWGQNVAGEEAVRPGPQCIALALTAQEAKCESVDAVLSAYTRICCCRRLSSLACCSLLCTRTGTTHPSSGLVMLWAQLDPDTCCCRGRGSVAWFPVHCTSINNTNDLISGDNKGVAAQLFKRWAGSQVRNSQ